MLIIRQLVGQLGSKNLQTISETRRDGISLAYRLTQMIYAALAEVGFF